MNQYSQIVPAPTNILSFQCWLMIVNENSSVSLVLICVDGGRRGAAPWIVLYINIAMTLKDIYCVSWHRGACSSIQILRDHLYRLFVCLVRMACLSSQCHQAPLSNAHKQMHLAKISDILSHLFQVSLLVTV